MTLEEKITILSEDIGIEHVLAENGLTNFEVIYILWKSGLIDLELFDLEED